MTTRKRRTVKNAYADVAHVDTPPGPLYCNWKRITKQMLEGREVQLLMSRKSKIELIVNQTQRLPNTNPLKTEKQPFVIAEDIITATINAMSQTIQQWDGVNISRVKTPPQSYREYYDKGKNYWDRNKVKVCGAIFWVHVFKQIHQFVDMNDTKLLAVLHALFQSKIKFHNTRAQALVNGMVMLLSKPFQQYFLDLDPSFTIHQWIEEQNTSKALRKKMLAHLNWMIHRPRSTPLSPQLNNQTHSTIHSDHGYMPSQGNNVGAHHDLNPSYLYGQLMQMMYEEQTPTIGSYGGYRSNPLVVSDFRYSPITAIHVGYPPQAMKINLIIPIFPIAPVNVPSFH
eukprot:351674_1